MVHGLAVWPPPVALPQAVDGNAQRLRDTNLLGGGATTRINPHDLVVGDLEAAVLDLIDCGDRMKDVLVGISTARWCIG